MDSRGALKGKKQQLCEVSSLEKQLREMQEQLEKEQTEEILKAKEESLKQKEEELETRDRQQEKLKIELIMNLHKVLKEFDPAVVSHSTFTLRHSLYCHPPTKTTRKLIRAKKWKSWEPKP